MTASTTEPVVTDSGCIVFARNKTACPQDPVRVSGRQGVWRLLKVWRGPDHVTWFAEVVGAYSPRSPQRTQEISRIFAVNELRHAGKATRDDVKMGAEAAQLSIEAKRGRPRR